MKLQRFLEKQFNLEGDIDITIESAILKYNKMYEDIMRNNLKFTIKPYRLVGVKKYIVHVIVPSQTIKGMNYDVVFEFSDLGDSIEDSHIRIFSNCPSFVFRYAFVFYHLEDDERKSQGLIIDQFDMKIPKNNLLADSTMDKLGEEIVHHAPVIRNKHGLPMFDKSLYLAIFCMQEKLNLAKLKRAPYRKLDLILKDVRDYEDILYEYEFKRREERAAEARRKAKLSSKKVQAYVEDQLRQGKSVTLRNNKSGKKIHTRNVRKITPKRSSNSKGVRKVGKR